MSDSSAPAVASVNVNGSPSTPEAAPLEPQTAQTQPQTKIEVPKQDDRFASKFAALSKKEKDLREREGKSKAEIEAIKAESEQYRNKYGQYATLDETLKTDKRAGLKFLMDKGLTAEELSDMLLEELQPNPDRQFKREISDTEKRMMERLAELEGKLTAKEQAEVEAQKEAAKVKYDETVTHVKSELKQFIDASDDYELIKLNGEYETVFDVMQEHYDDQVNKGVSPDKIKILSYEEAAKWTETYLDEQATRQYEAKRAKQALKTTPVQPKPTSPTLSNTMSTEVPNAVEPRAKSREESLRNAARMLKYNAEE